MSGRVLVLRLTRWAVDVGVLVVAWWLAHALRFEYAIPPDHLDRMLTSTPYVVLLQFVFLAGLAVHRATWQYVGMRDLATLVRAVMSSSAVLVGLRLGAELFMDPTGVASIALAPYSVILADAAFVILGLAGVRFLRRAQSERHEIQTRAPSETTQRCLVVGAGRAGAMIAKEIRSRPDLGRTVVGFVDDDPNKIGMRIAGRPVLASTSRVAAVVAEHEIDDVIIAIANATGDQIRRITDEVEQTGLTPNILPGLYELVDGQVNLSRIRPVAIEDLLRRDQVELDNEGIAEIVTDEVVMVTGAGGSIGSELARQVARFAPRRLVLVERAETPLWAIHRELLQAYPDLDVVPALVDICDPDMVRRAMLQHRPSTVFHAAAHKHVAMCERNPLEAVHNNVLGTVTCVDAAVDAGVDRFVLVSTDKAVNPSNVMGATKRVAERYVQSRALETGRAFVSVRFGNVLGSNGSVVPIFKEQIRNGGPITVTHPEMTRFFMTIPEASALVVQAAALGSPGDLFVLEMGEPVKIVDLAADLIRLSGLDEDAIEMVFTGPVEGEKLHEELKYGFEELEPTTNPDIRRRGAEPAVLTDSDLGLIRSGHGRSIVDGLFRLATGEGVITLPGAHTAL